MSDDIHPLSRREGPVPPPEPGKRPEVPLDTSLPDACVHQRMCLALLVQAQGGKGKFLFHYAFFWGLTVLLGVVLSIATLSIWWLSLLMPAGVLGLALLITVIAAVVYRIKGHRGWCWIARSMDLGEHSDVIMGALSFLPDLILVWAFDTLQRLLRLERRRPPEDGDQTK
ncbi:hypothetical protein ACIBF6_10370 [Streptosporangium amethystogenes]|uniref:hypothetical protein n=1 Tax=Streptosporangium amethystogenes TaxID=2002 RepID=UPI0037AB3E55